MSSPAGWYPDPHDATQMRYWDGVSWTGQAQPLAATAPPTPPQPQLPGTPPQAAVPQPPAQPAPQPPVSQAAPQPPAQPQAAAPQPPAPGTPPQAAVPQPPTMPGTLPPSAPMPPRSVGQDQGVVALVLGIAGLVFCAPLGIVSLVMGIKARNQSRMSGLPLDGTMKAGWILGIIDTVITGVIVLIFLIALIAGASSDAASLALLGR